ncbi:galactose-3-O-sulfotransferase 3-like [Branchiostoma floridae]|uniref:Galactose-3-O-sulfotransferase 3-like n=1 Tax=Branchiostoma floridae TaxID=7739 RepID=A0A9J7LU12_BRAFL|nr:galactose-3-O-sulfotransferase 3-like [Branchiostoma floridae]
MLDNTYQLYRCIPRNMTLSCYLKKNRMFSYRISDEGNLETSNQTAKMQCTRQNNFVFAKVHKCGSSTIQAIFFHYAYNHKLIVALPMRTRRAWIGKPHNITSKSYRATPGGKQWNIFNHHNVYDKEMFLKLMPPDTKFVTILREPSSRISSAFNYFHLHNFFTGMSDSVTKNRTSPVKIFMNDPWYWEKRFHPPLKTGAGSIYDYGCIRNCIAHDLGLEEKRRTDPDAVKRYIEELDEDFTTVMVLERLDESLVMLKRRMCWSLRDIIYRKGTRLKSRSYKFKGESVQLKGSDMKNNFTQKMLDNFKNFSAADFAIYNHFYAKLSKEIAKEGQDFVEEVTQFQNILADVGHYCRTPHKAPVLWLEKSKWNARFSIDVKFCTLLRKERPGWAGLLKRQYYDHV